MSEKKCRNKKHRSILEWVLEFAELVIEIVVEGLS